jgi:hypothetical protein
MSISTPRASRRLRAVAALQQEQALSLCRRRRTQHGAERRQEARSERLLPQWSLQQVQASQPRSARFAPANAA